MANMNPEERNANRITTRFGAELNGRVRAWAQSHGMPTMSEALRAIVASAMVGPGDSAWTAAYEQMLSDLRLLTRTILKDVVARLDHAPAGAFGGRGPFRLPVTHSAGMRVPQGGSSCASCRFLAPNGRDCTEENFVLWNGSSRIPGPINSYCSDWYETRAE